MRTCSSSSWKRAVSAPIASASFSSGTSSFKSAMTSGKRPKRPQQPRCGGAFAGIRTLGPASRTVNRLRLPLLYMRIEESGRRLQFDPDQIPSSNLLGDNISRCSNTPNV